MVGRNRAGSHGSATVELRTLYFSPVYYSMQRDVNTCDKTATMPRNSELVEAMILALRGYGESRKTSRYGHTLIFWDTSWRRRRRFEGSHWKTGSKEPWLNWRGIGDSRWMTTEVHASCLFTT